MRNSFTDECAVRLFMLANTDAAFYLHFPGGATLCFCRGLNSLGAL